MRLGAGLAYSLVFSTLLVKCVFLISLNGGVYLPAPYQALLLFFAVLIQLAIGAQWLINNPPRVIQVPNQLKYYVGGRMMHFTSCFAAPSHQIKQG